jgi:hypothetical protein
MRPRACIPPSAHLVCTDPLFPPDVHPGMHTSRRLSCVVGHACLSPLICSSMHPSVIPCSAQHAYLPPMCCPLCMHTVFYLPPSSFPRGARVYILTLCPPYSLQLSMHTSPGCIPVCYLSLPRVYRAAGAGALVNSTGNPRILLGLPDPVPEVYQST